MSARGRIARAELRAAGGPALVLVLLVALAAGVAAAVPSTLLRATSAELTSSLSELTENQRNPGGQLRDFSVLAIAAFGVEGGIVVADESGVGAEGDDPVFGGLRAALAESIAAQPEPLRSALGEPETVVVGEPVELPPGEPRDDDPGFLIRPVLDSGWQQRLTVVGGRLPDPWDTSGALTGPILEPLDETATPAIIELALTAEGSETLRWPIGEQRLDAATGFAFELVGLVALVEPESAYWQRVPGVPAPERFDDGNQRPRETAAAFLHPQSLGAPGTIGVLDVRLPLALDAVDAVTVDRLLPQLRALTSTPITLPTTHSGGAPTVALALESGVPAAADAVLARTAGVTALLALAAAAPLGALAVIVLLAAQVIIERRRAVLALRLARGASRSRIRLEVAASTLTLSVPAVLVGAGLGVLGSLLIGTPAALVVGAVVTPTALLALLALALVPTLVAATLVPRPADLRDRRVDGVGASRGRALLDIVLLALAAVAVLALVQRAAAGGSGSTVASAAALLADPLLLATPLLVALAASVLVGRALPGIMAAVHALVARRSKAVTVVGVRRASRDRTGRPALVVTLLATSAAIWSLSTLVVVDTALDDAARDSLGASVRVTGPGATAALAERLGERPQVAAAGGVDVVGPAVLSVEGVRENATVIAVDAVAASLRADAPADFAADPAPLEGAVAAILSADLLATLDDLEPGALPSPDAAISVGGVRVTVVGVGRPSAGYGSSGSWVVVAEVDAPRFTRAPAIDTVLIEPTPGTTSAELAGAVDSVAAELALEPGAVRITVAAELADADRAAPLTAALRAALVGGAALAALLTASALALTAVAGRPRRHRIQALLQTLGTPPSSAITLWELAPAALLGGIAGTAVGALLLPLTAAAVDLRVVTAADAAADAAAVAIDPLVVGGTLAALALVSAAVIAAASLVDRRPALLSTLRTESS